MLKENIVGATSRSPLRATKRQVLEKVNFSLTINNKPI